MNVDMSAQFQGVAGMVERAAQQAVEATSQQILMDCNYYCKQDTSALINSSLIHSETDKGLLRWVTPYAEFQYNFPNTRHDVNPHATPQWCNTAQNNHLTEWGGVFENAIRRSSG